MSHPSATDTPRRGMVVLAFATVYLVWGSTYAAIMFAIETLPPMLMAGVRFLIAGGLLYGWLRMRGAPRPGRVEWRVAAIVGVLLLTVGNGAVVWAEQIVASGPAALMVATVAFWMVLLEWLRPGGVRPTFGVVAGLVVGFIGLAVLVAPGELGGGGIDLLGAGVLLVGTLAWAVGSIYSRGAPRARSTLQAAAMQMLAGGAALLLVGLVMGEPAAMRLGEASMRSWLGLGYLIVFGSLIGFTAYAYLLRVSTPAKVATYAFVNPVVAMLLGWAVVSEPLTVRMAVAMAVIVGAVALITMTRARALPAPPAAACLLESGGPPDPASGDPAAATRIPPYPGRPSASARSPS